MHRKKRKLTYNIMHERTAVKRGDEMRGFICAAGQRAPRATRVIAAAPAAAAAALEIDASFK